MKAVRVATEDAEGALEHLSARGLLDSGRRVVERQGGVEIPVTSDVPGLDTVIQRKPVPRDQVLTPRERMARSLPEERIPDGWKRIGDVIVADLGGDGEAAEELLKAHDGCSAVVDLSGINGRLRIPEAHLLAGEPDTETVHREHGISYLLDPREVMFSPGNSEERRRVRDMTRRGERVLDMFAGVGQFALPAAKGGGRVLAVDANPEAAGYLKKNARLNDLELRVDVVLGDSKTCSPEDRFDRVLMGHLDSAGYLGAAARALDGGGWLHYHEACPEKSAERPVKRVSEAVERAGFRTVSLDRREVKGYSPGVGHFVVDCLVE